jgi:predicted DCC family thiol-disulfide oxidoreductase YuxK
MRDGEPSAGLSDGPIILFDAACVLCSANAQFVLTHDRSRRFRLASMQSEIGAAIARRHGMDPHDPSSMLVIEGRRVRRDSDAVLSIYEGLGLPWRLLVVLRIVPVVLRDPVYRWVARNRYRVFRTRDRRPCLGTLGGERPALLQHVEPDSNGAANLLRASGADTEGRARYLALAELVS